MGVFEAGDHHPVEREEHKKGAKKQHLIKKASLEAGIGRAMSTPSQMGKDIDTVGEQEAHGKCHD
jgi:hypothetical protein